MTPIRSWRVEFSHHLPIRTFWAGFASALFLAAGFVQLRYGGYAWPLGVLLLIGSVIMGLAAALIIKTDRIDPDILDQALRESAHRHIPKPRDWPPAPSPAGWEPPSRLPPRPEDAAEHEGHPQ